ncbi:MAG: hypothetical protein H0X11_12745 [Betaproteobacteria bacterium]|nr:hypothetical protein [Betaproteobacteria bacterium]
MDATAMFQPMKAVVPLAVGVLLCVVNEDESFSVDRDAGGSERVVELAQRRGVRELHLNNAGTTMGLNKNGNL